MDNLEVLGRIQAQRFHFIHQEVEKVQGKVRVLRMPVPLTLEVEEMVGPQPMQVVQEERALWL